MNHPFCSKANSSEITTLTEVKDILFKRCFQCLSSCGIHETLKWFNQSEVGFPTLEMKCNFQGNIHTEHSQTIIEVGQKTSMIYWICSTLFIMFCFFSNFYRLLSEGDNVLGSVSPSVRPSVHLSCITLKPTKCT